MGITGLVRVCSGRRGVLGGGSGSARVLRIFGRREFFRRVGFDGRAIEADRMGLVGLAAEQIGGLRKGKVAQCAPAIAG